MGKAQRILGGGGGRSGGIRILHTHTHTHTRALSWPCIFLFLCRRRFERTGWDGPTATRQEQPVAMMATMTRIDVETSTGRKTWVKISPSLQIPSFRMRTGAPELSLHLSCPRASCLATTPLTGPRGTCRHFLDHFPAREQLTLRRPSRIEAIPAKQTIVRHPRPTS